MTIDEIKLFFKDCPLTSGNVRLSSLINITEYVDVQLKMDDKTLDYYFGIDLLEIEESNMPQDYILYLKESGWAISEDNKELVKYLDNNING